MRIGVNALYLIPGGVGGTEIYLRCLLAAFAAIDRENEYFVFTNAETGCGLVPEQPNFHSEPQNVHAVNRPARILWEQTLLPIAAMRRKIDVLFNPGFTAPAFAGMRQVTVFHDLQHKRHPEYFRWFDLPFWRLCLWASAHRSDRLIADSEATRVDLLRFYTLPEAKIRTVPLGVDEVFFSIADRRREERMVLAVSTSHPHKNLDGLMQAFAASAASRAGYKLVIAGLRGFAAQELEGVRDSLGLRESVSFTGWIPREELYDLFARASAFIYPSRFEGFGLPVLEALAAGIPSACANRDPMASVAGGAALLFDPDDPAAIARAIDRLTQDDELRSQLALRGPERARQFSWEQTARETLKVISCADPTVRQS